MFSRIALVCALLLSVFPFAARADEAKATLTGMVQTTAGTPVPGAQITVTGPQRAVSSSDSSGHFSVSLAPGIYHLDVAKGGFVPTSLDDIVLAIGQTQPLSVTLTAADLNRLNTIARVTVSRRSSINTGAASTNYVDTSTLRNFAFPQISNVVQTIPGAAIQRGSSNPNVTISLAGSQPYETQTLIDGHPLATGRTGTFYAQFLNQYIVQGIETQLGPGNTTPFAGTAVGGTANIVTPSFTTKPVYSYLQGADTTGSLYGNWLASGKFGRLSYVADYASGGYDGPFYNRNACVLAPQSKATWNTPAAVGIITFCGPVGSALRSKGEVAKLRYDFSNATSLELGYIGSQSGYFPQNITYGVDARSVNIQQCLNLSYKGTPVQQCSSPLFSQFVGTSTQAYFFYPGSNVYYNVPLFEGQLRTALGNNTMLVRPYAGAITRQIDGSGEANYPAFWFPNSEGTAPGTLGYNYCQAQEDGLKQAPPGYNYFGQTVNGYTSCNQTPYSTYEHDVLHGTTVSFIHPFGENDVTATYDYHSDQSFSNVGNFAGTPQVPVGTVARYNLFSVTGNFVPGRNVRAKAGLYYNNWQLNGTTTVSQSATGIVSGPLSTSQTRVDPHVALSWRPQNATSYRLSAGTSTTFPYALLVSGTSTFVPASGTGSSLPTVTQKNPNLAPERAAEFSIGMDHRFANGSILTLDLLATNISNVFETLTTVVPTTLYPQGAENLNQPINAANLNNKIAIVGYRYAPAFGFGYNGTMTFARSVVNGIPIQFYGAKFGVPANGVQQCADGSGNTVCVPYLKGYFNANYTFRDASYVGLGVDIEGKNNTYYQPPFAVWDLVGRHPINSNLDAQISVYNLLNTNNFGNLPTPNAGVPQIGENNAGQLGSYFSSSLPYPLIPVQQRTAYFQLRLHIGDQK